MVFDPFFMLAPVYGPFCLFLIFRREAQEDAGRAIWPRLSTILLAVPGAYGLGSIYLMLFSLPDGSLPGDLFDELMVIALGAGILSAIAAHAAAVIVRRKRRKESSRT